MNFIDILFGAIFGIIVYLAIGTALVRVSRYIDIIYFERVTHDVPFWIVFWPWTLLMGFLWFLGTLFGWILIPYVKLAKAILDFKP